VIFLKKVVGIFYHGGKQGKKKEGHGREHPPNVKVDEQATDKKAINKIMKDK
jgi:hypothetical protein